MDELDIVLKALELKGSSNVPQNPPIPYQCLEPHPH